MSTILTIIIIVLVLCATIIGAYIAYLRFYLGYRNHARAHAMRVDPRPIRPEDMASFNEDDDDD